MQNQSRLGIYRSQGIQGLRQPIAVFHGSLAFRLKVAGRQRSTGSPYKRSVPRAFKILVSILDQATTAHAYFAAQLDSLSHSQPNPGIRIAQHIPLTFEIGHKPTCLDTHRWLRVQLKDDGWDVQIVQLRKFPRPQFVVAVLSGAVMSRAQRDRGRIG